MHTTQGREDGLPAQDNPENDEIDIRLLERMAREQIAERRRLDNRHRQAIAEAKRLQAEAQEHVSNAIHCMGKFVDAIRRVRAGAGF